jgi:hypothetical protein
MSARRRTVNNLEDLIQLFVREILMTIPVPTDEEKELALKNMCDLFCPYGVRGVDRSDEAVEAELRAE